MLPKNTKEKRSLLDSIHSVRIKLNWSIRKSDISIDFLKKKDFQNFLGHISRIGMNKIYIIKMAVTKMDFLVFSDSVAVKSNRIVPANQKLSSKHQFEISTLNQLILRALRHSGKLFCLYSILILLQFTCIFI